jgi:3-keto-5-aminohexanoate cleavage enzyme
MVRLDHSAAEVIKMKAASPLPPVVLAVAPNGGRRTKADHPAIPLAPQELALAAAECLEAGASMIHVHVRKPDGAHLLDADAYRAAIAAIRASVGEKMVIQISSEALELYTPAEQSAVVRAVKPEAVSLALRELAPDAAAESGFADLLLWLKRERVAPQIILYSMEEAVRLSQMQRRGLIPWEHIPVLFALGRYAIGQTAWPIDLLPFLAPGAPVFRHWMVCAFGRDETGCVVAAALLGGHGRVGFENNLLLPDGATAKSNGDLVAAARLALESCGRTVATAQELRGMAAA